MKQFGTIFRFEFLNYLKNKVFVGVTLFLMAAIVIVMFSPRAAGLLEQGREPEKSEKPVMLLAADSSLSGRMDDVLASFADAFSDYDVRLTDGDPAGIREQILSGEAECAFVLRDISSYTYYVDDLALYDMNTSEADEILGRMARRDALIGKGLSGSEADQILSLAIEHDTERLGQDQAQNFFYTYIMIFALYMVILFYGQMVATHVASEKSSRAMELLITSAKPVSLMFGKVIASCLAGLLQLVCVFGSAFLCFQVNRSYWSGNEIIRSIFDMPLHLLAYMFLFFILGFLIYAFMYGAVGSTVSKLEDINTAVMPITLVFIAAFLVVVSSMSSGDVDNIWMKVCSYVPFTSPMAMFTRIAMSTVPWYAIVVSVLILLGSAVGTGVISAGIYRRGVLMYGAAPKIGAVLKKGR